MLTLAFSRVSIHSPLEMESLFLTQKGYPIKNTSKGFKIQLRELYSSRIPVKNARTDLYGHTSKLNMK